MTKSTTKTYLVGVIERAITYFVVEAEDARTAAENWEEGEFRNRDDEALESEGPCNVRERQPDGTYLKLPPSQWEPVLPAGRQSGKKPYSVLLLYPDYANDNGTETYYAFVEALDPIEAVALAQREAVTTQDGMDGDPEDFALELAETFGFGDSIGALEIGVQQPDLGDACGNVIIATPLNLGETVIADDVDAQERDLRQRFLQVELLAQ